MNHLGAADAAFLYAETDRCPMSIASVQVMALPPGLDEDAFVDAFRAQIDARKHLVPYLTHKLQFVPFSLDHPVWVRDAGVNVMGHIRRVDVAAPGGRAEFDAAIATLHEERLDRDRPLWDMAVLCGLENGRVAIYNRVHHACVDGMAGQAAIRAMYDTEPEPRVVEASAACDEPTRYADEELLGSAVVHLMTSGIDQWTKTLARFEAGWRLAQRAADPTRGLNALTRTAPRTRFNVSVDRSRTFASAEFDFDTLHGLARQHGATLNEVFLAICGGAARRYLVRRGELPAEDLLAGCPVSLRKPGDHSLDNQVTMMRVALGTSIEDPVARLRGVVCASKEARELVADTSDLLPGDPGMPGLPAAAAAGAEMAERFDLAGRAAVPFNLVVSDVPGPRHALYAAGASMESHYPVSIPAHGSAVNITVQSYRGTMYVGITACARALPDGDRLRDDLMEEFAALRAASAARPVTRLRRKRTRKAVTTSRQGTNAVATAPRVAEVA
jgi:WS/DGAT/MGAT family acyltransferase